MNASRGDERNEFLCYDWYPDVRKIDKVSDYKRLERQYQLLQASYFDLCAEMSRLQFFLRQIVEAGPRDRDRMINELKSKIFRDVDTSSQVHDDCLPTLQQHDMEMGDFKRRQYSLIEILREQVGSLEKASEGISTEARTAESNADSEPYPQGELKSLGSDLVADPENENNAANEPKVVEKDSSNKPKRYIVQKVIQIPGFKEIPNSIEA